MSLPCAQSLWPKSKRSTIIVLMEKQSFFRQLVANNLAKKLSEQALIREKRVEKSLK